MLGGRQECVIGEIQWVISYCNRSKEIDGENSKLYDFCTDTS